MERSNGRLLASSQGMAKTEAPRLRKKLQKSTPKQRGQVAKRAVSGASNEASTDNKFDTATKRTAQAQPCAPLPDPDLSDAKWSEYLRDSGYVGKDLPDLPANIIPELSHLAIAEAKSKSRSSLDNLSPESPSSTTSSSSTMRRLHAKTPVFNIGQLEAGTVPRPRNALAAQKVPSAEVIADQYKALLSSCSPMFADSHSEPPPSRHGDVSDLGVRRQHSSDELPYDSAFPHGSPGFPNASSSSDDGTLVSFEEETVYFKPVSFSPEPTSPTYNFENLIISLSPAPAPDNLSLQICLDLLTRDLSSAVGGRPNSPSPEASALQIWVMIEAYEKLRDRLFDTRLCHENVQQLEAMFDLWLRALYTIHDSLNPDIRSESDYDALGVEDLD